MCEAVEKYAESYAESYAERIRIDTLYESVKNLMKSMKWSDEEAMTAMQISEKDRAVLLKRL